MIIVTCLPCALAVRILPENVADPRSGAELDQLVGARSEFWPDKFPCVRCDGQMTGMREVEADPRVLQLMEMHNLTPQEAFAAFNGLGLPLERACTLATLQELFREQPVRRIVGGDIEGTTTVHIDAIELWDGTKVHFGAGSSGAVVFRVVRPPAYAQRILEGASHAD